MLLAQTLEMLSLRPGMVVVDATVGLGGHSAAILGAQPDVRLVGFDVDPAALAIASRKLEPWGDRAVLVNAPYARLEQKLRELDLLSVDAILFDLGVSSLQLDTPERGFSFRHDAPLDMRFSSRGPDAAELLASASEAQLMQILRDYGEEPRARRVARAIVRARERAPITTTGELHRIVRAALGRGRGRIDPATRTFQAVRIATNRELEDLPSSLEDAAHLLKPLGRLAVIAFHSIEDRIVKQTFRRLSGRCVCPPGQMVCECGPKRLLEVLTRKPLRPSQAETDANPRARSARLRVAERRSP